LPACANPLSLPFAVSHVGALPLQATAHAAPRQVLRASPSQPVVGRRQRRAAASALLRKHSRRRGAGALCDLLMRGCGVKGRGVAQLLDVFCSAHRHLPLKYSAAVQVYGRLPCGRGCAACLLSCSFDNKLQLLRMSAVNNRLFPRRGKSTARLFVPTDSVSQYPRGFLK